MEMAGSCFSQAVAFDSLDAMAACTDVRSSPAARNCQNATTSYGGFSHACPVKEEPCHFSAKSSKRSVPAPSSSHAANCKFYEPCPPSSPSLYAVFRPSLPSLPTLVVSMPLHTPHIQPSKVVSFRDDDVGFPDVPSEKASYFGDAAFRTKMQVAYSPWALQMVASFSVPETVPSKENLGGGNDGKGPRNGDGGGNDGNGDEEGEGEGEGEDLLLPGLTLAFAALHLGYFVTTWLKEEGVDPHFTRTALSLLGLLAISLVRMSCQGGVDAYIIGLSASVGVMIWAAERSVSQRKATPGGIMAAFGAAMSFIFTAALYECA